MILGMSESFNRRQKQEEKEKAKAIKERDRLYNDALNAIEQLISSTKDPNKVVNLGRVRYDLMAEWDLERKSSK